MLSVCNVSVRFGRTRALDSVSLDVADGEVVAVLGPSGAGKTTLLRVIAGLEHPESGTVTWNGEDLDGTPAHQRGFGMVFQDFALFPHLDVGANVEFGLRMQGVNRSERAEMAAAALRAVDLAGYERRAIGTLSGGQAQRVALARALAPRPRMLLFDEPLGSLDRALRERLAAEVRRMISGPGITALYVTHDQGEAFTVADRVAVFDEGRVLQSGTPHDLWHRPESAQVARFLGFRSVLEATITSGWADTVVGLVPVPAGTPDGRASIVIRPDALRIDPGGPIAGSVRAARFRGSDHLLDVEVGGAELQVATPRAVAPGTLIRLGVAASGVVVLRSDDLVERSGDLGGQPGVEAGEEDRSIESP
jgi:thiamine transport system ATP-binding protein